MNGHRLPEHGAASPDRVPGVAGGDVDFGPEGYPRWPVAVASLIVGMFMVILDTSIVNIAIPAVETTFRVGTSQVEWVVTVYLLALGVSAPTAGWLADRVGYKRLYLAGMGVFTLGSLLAAVSPSLPILVGARVVQAVGGGMVPPTTTALLFRMVPRHRLGTANGYRGIALLLGPAVGPTLGGYLVQYVSWRWIFTINLPVGVLGILFAAAAIPEVFSRRDSRFDVKGFLTASAGLATLLYALSEGNVAGWGSPLILGALAAAALLLPAFVWIELRAPDPLIDLRVLRLTSFTASMGFVVTTSVALFSGVFFLPIFLQLVRGEGALRAGLVLMPGAVATAVVMPLAGRIYDWMDAKLPVVVGTCVLAVATWLFRGLTLTTPDGTIAAWSALRGAGMGLAMMPAMTAGMSVVPQLGVSRAAAMRNVVQRTSASFGIALLTLLLDLGISGAGVPLDALRTAAYRLAFTQSLDRVFTLLAAVALLGVVPALLLRGDRGQWRAPGAPASGLGAGQGTG